MMHSMNKPETGARASLAQRLRSDTASLHAQAERSGVMPDLLRGKLDRLAYCRLLRNLHEIYLALERELTRHAAHCHIAPIYAAELLRHAALGADLDVLHGPGWKDTLQVASACAQYVARLQGIGDANPGMLVAHAYVRYLGDLSGGQILRGIVTDALHLNGEGVRFYEFPAPGAVTLAERFRAGLNSIDLDDAVAAAIIAEAKLAFGLHVRLFDELATAGQRADVQASGRLGDKLC